MLDSRFSLRLFRMPPKRQHSPRALLPADPAVPFRKYLNSTTSFPGRKVSFISLLFHHLRSGIHKFILASCSMPLVSNERLQGHSRLPPGNRLSGQWPHTAANGLLRAYGSPPVRGVGSPGAALSIIGIACARRSPAMAAFRAAALRAGNNAQVQETRPEIDSLAKSQARDRRRNGRGPSPPHYGRGGLS